MLELYERVARGIWNAQVVWDGFPSPHRTWEEMPEGDPVKLLVRYQARRAVEAMLCLPFGELGNV